MVKYIYLYIFYLLVFKGDYLYWLKFIVFVGYIFVIRFGEVGEGKSRLVIFLGLNLFDNVFFVYVLNGV